MSARRIDYRRTGWGHNLEARTTPDGMLRGVCWYAHGVRVGDEMTWRTGYGTAVGVVREAQWLRDPSDMYRIVVEVTERHVEEVTA